MASPPKRPRRRLLFGLLLVAWLVVVACVSSKPGQTDLHRWWSGLGPVLPHSNFPDNCGICHVGQGWTDLKEDFEFDHEKRTGVKLEGAHNQAKCLRCHNDRGPVSVFQSQGCKGCHQDVHQGGLGFDCTKCHQQQSWRPIGQVALHEETRFPLVGAHMTVSCQRCHPGAFTGKFTPTDNRCVTCHVKELNNTNNPNHIGLGWTDQCGRCHTPTRWNNGSVK